MTSPPAPIRRISAAVLILQALVILLALRPVQQFSGVAGDTVVWTLGVAAGVCVLLSGVQRFQIGWYLALASPVALAVAGVVMHWSVLAVAALFGGVWLYVAHVRRAVA